MISRISGRVVAVHEHSLEVQVGDVTFALDLSAHSARLLAPLNGQVVNLFTLLYLDGNPAVGHIAPRLVGFVSESERSFFDQLTRVKGIGNRKALRAMSAPPADIAAAIERGDERFLTSLPEIGKRTAAQMITELRGQMQAFMAESQVSPAGIPQWNEAQRIALEILVQWGDRRGDAERWLAAAVEEDPALTDPEALVRTAYRIKHGPQR